VHTSLPLLTPPHSAFFPPRRSPDLAFLLFPYTTLFRSCRSSRSSCARDTGSARRRWRAAASRRRSSRSPGRRASSAAWGSRGRRSEEHTSELQSPYDLVCRLLLEKKKKTKKHKE